MYVVADHNDYVVPWYRYRTELACGEWQCQLRIRELLDSTRESVVNITTLESIGYTYEN